MKLLKCPNCSREFKNQVDLQLHFYRDHVKAKK